MDILRVTAKWQGFNGAPGYSAFHFAGGGGLISDAQQVADRTKSALSWLSGVLPTGLQIFVQSEVERIDSATGEILDFETVDPPGGLSGTASGGYSAASGAVVNWRTNDVRFGRRIRGRTFLVPLAGSAYEDDGTLSSAARGTISQFYGGLVGGDLDSEFGIWSRPRNGAGGVFATVTSGSVPDMAAVLRSRRD